MNVDCVICKAHLDARVEIQRCVCGINYGLTPYFPYDDQFYRLNKIYRNSKEVQEKKGNRALDYRRDFNG